MNYLIRHWRGDVPVWQAAWLSSIIGILISVPANYLEIRDLFTANHLTSLGDLIGSVGPDGSLSLTMPSLSLQLTALVIDTLSMIWWSVGSWRACDREGAETGKGYWGFKSSIAISVLLGLYEIYDFATGL